MTILIIIAVVGWVLFLLTAIFYMVGNKSNVEESQSLAVYSLAVLLSDEFREANRKGFESAMHEGRSKGMDTQAVTYGLVQGVARNAKRCYKGQNREFRYFGFSHGLCQKSGLTSRRSQPPLALSVPLSRITCGVGGGRLWTLGST